MDNKVGAGGWLFKVELDGVSSQSCNDSIITIKVKSGEWSEKKKTETYFIVNHF
jgi:hypothetical protein